MKKILIAIIAIVLSLSTQSFSALAYNNYSSVVIGDIDGDGTVTTSDVLSLMIYLANVGVGNPVEKPDMTRADVDKSGELDSSDLFYIMYYIAQTGAGCKNVTWPPEVTVTTTTTQETIPAPPEETTTQETIPTPPEEETTTQKTTITLPKTTTSVEFADDSNIAVGDIFMFVGPNWNVRSTPETDFNGNIVKILQEGDCFKVVTVWQTDYWVEIEFEGERGMYVQMNRMKYFQKIKNTSTTEADVMTTQTTTTQTTTTKMTTAVKTTTSTTTTSTTTANTKNKYQIGDVVQFSGKSWNCRKDIGGEIIDKVTHNGTFVIIRNVTSNWYEISYSGKISYIDLAQYWYFSKTGTLSECKIDADVTVGDILRFKSTSWNIYASENSSKAYYTLRNNQTFAIVEKNGNCLRIVTNEGKEGFIFYDFKNLTIHFKILK